MKRTILSTVVSAVMMRRPVMIMRPTAVVRSGINICNVSRHQGTGVDRAWCEAELKFVETTGTENVRLLHLDTPLVVGPPETSPIPAG